MEELNTLAFFWPATNSHDKAVLAARQGFIASLFISCISPIYLILRLVSMQSLQYFYIIFIPVIVYALLAVLIFKLSRIAAILGLILALPALVFSISNPGLLLIVPIALTLSFINSIRGTFAYHRIKRTAKT